MTTNTSSSLQTCWQAVDTDCWQLCGDLSFATVGQALQEFQTLCLTVAYPHCIDLQQLGRCDSAGLALLVEILSQAQRAAVSLRLQNAPTQLQRLAELSGISDLLDARGQG